jgi:hypothetical protein
MATPREALADKIAPRLRAILEARRDEIVASAGGFARREAVRLAFPSFLDNLPALVRSALDLISDEFGHMNINDFLAYLENHAS